VAAAAAAAHTATDYPPVAVCHKHEPDLSIVGAEGTRVIVVIELLCFLSNKSYNYPITVIKKTTMDFSREDELFSAKQMLMQYVSDKRIQQYSRK